MLFQSPFVQHGQFIFSLLSASLSDTHIRTRTQMSVICPHAGSSSLSEPPCLKTSPWGQGGTCSVGSNHAAVPLNLFLLKVASEQHKTGEEGWKTPWTKSIAGNSYTRTHPTPTELSQSQADLIALRASREHTLHRWFPSSSVCKTKCAIANTKNVVIWNYSYEMTQKHR